MFTTNNASTQTRSDLGSAISHRTSWAIDNGQGASGVAILCKFTSAYGAGRTMYYTASLYLFDDATDEDVFEALSPEIKGAANAKAWLIEQAAKAGAKVS